ncbi:glutaredoxin domain-containing protein [Micromonospora parva]|uniref:glutaredoxin domain-containing protein n=1 Tax=Micromonospora parva TaxID=1464048 RepID=UPI000A8661B6|nr:glutaredoxin domain-containing protein [Micromonospora parva]
MKVTDLAAAATLVPAGSVLGVLRRWVLAILMAACGVLVAASQLTAGLPAVGAVELVVFLVLALLLSPWAFPRSVSAAEARRASAVDGRPIVYWRPGCRYCLQLRFSLGRLARRAHWVDIWHDPAAAAAVRAVAGGNETVPTVVLGERAVVNPDRAWFRQQLRSS